MLEVRVAENEDEAVLESDGGYPDVVLGDWAAFSTQCVLGGSIDAGRSRIAGQDIGAFGKGFELYQVLLGSRGLSRSVVKFAQDDDRREDLVGWGTSSSSLKEAIATLVSVRKPSSCIPLPVSTIHPGSPFQAPLR